VESFQVVAIVPVLLIPVFAVLWMLERRKSTR